MNFNKKDKWEFGMMVVGGFLAIFGAFINNLLGAYITLFGSGLIIFSSTLFYIDLYRSKFHQEVPYE